MSPPRLHRSSSILFALSACKASPNMKKPSILDFLIIVSAFSLLIWLSRGGPRSLSILTSSLYLELALLLGYCVNSFCPKGPRSCRSMWDIGDYLYSSVMSKCSRNVLVEYIESFLALDSSKPSIGSVEG